MRTLGIDIETFSDIDLTSSGVYAYTDSPNFEILLFAYAFDDEETKSWCYCISRSDDAWYDRLWKQ